MDAPHERRRQAVALAYKEDEAAPRVVAKGYGELAERIMAEAQRQGIYVHDAPELVALLMQLNLDTEIPASLYQVVAELLVWVFELSSDESTRLARRK
ncbi:MULTISPECIES: EscU/YscU/HrcU family type III secretion system export apparatus switch protein [unclassified Halomonas]|uniref:EscU/YscU/HrcU family type III secretion system export apparatus switch protein n=1 Tax=unclassified Halomonas TaxID=2609666 RepID=UPI00209D4AAE|nr:MULTISPECIES: EscU/YscU/HrcU family type III secretion system export apparatus switch protein [unclassified Halomonas]MCP1314798.1 EscU/YscU/HrcU family type III secretion system export apparatus switch protein [Halomonas sp. 707D7]MCP1325799.1 EscU/YscU/HrcU family type III secretion system export apparatus switch protein [Halomonas sp. 707D4]